MLIFNYCPIFDDVFSHFGWYPCTLDMTILRLIWYIVTIIDLHDFYMLFMMDACDECISFDVLNVMHYSIWLYYVFMYRCILMRWWCMILWCFYYDVWDGCSYLNDMVCIVFFTCICHDMDRWIKWIYNSLWYDECKCMI